MAITSAEAIVPQPAAAEMDEHGEQAAMAKKKRHSRAEIATKLAQANDLATRGRRQSEIARTLGVSVMTLHRWRKASHGPQAAHGVGQLATSIRASKFYVNFILVPRLPFFGPKTASGPRHWASSAEVSRSDMPLCGDADTTARREHPM